MNSEASKVTEASADWAVAVRGEPRSLSVRLAILGAKTLVSLVTLYLAFRAVDVRGLANRLASFSLPFFGLAVAATMLQVVFVAFRWRLIVNALEARSRLTNASALAIGFSAQFIGQVLPFAAGDAFRALLVIRGGASARTAATSVLIDRSMGFIVLLLLSLPPLLVFEWRAELSAISHLLLELVVAVLVGFMLIVALGPQLVAPMSSFALTRPLAALLTDLLRIFQHHRALAAVIVLSAVVQALSIAIVWILGYAVAAPLPMAALWGLVPPMLIATMLPFTVSGWGARESVVVAFLSGAGISPDTALLLSVSFGAALVVASLPGAVTWVSLLRWRA